MLPYLYHPQVECRCCYHLYPHQMQQKTSFILFISLMSLKSFPNIYASTTFSPTRKILPPLNFTFLPAILFTSQNEFVILQLWSYSHTLAVILQILSSFVTRTSPKTKSNVYDGVSFKETQQDPVHSYVVSEVPEVPTTIFFFNEVHYIFLNSAS